VRSPGPRFGRPVSVSFVAVPGGVAEDSGHRELEGVGGEILVGGKGYAGREFAAGVDALGATIVRPRRPKETGRGKHLALIPKRIE
jgi:hypothetical protein